MTIRYCPADDGYTSRYYAWAPMAADIRAFRKTSRVTFRRHRKSELVADFLAKVQARNHAASAAVGKRERKNLRRAA